MKTYKIIRFFKSGSERETITKGLTLEQAKAHCKDPETSSVTCTSPEGKFRTEVKGPWFDGFEEE